ncbi:SDR family NAD(P)-dependent oxidoreductase [Pontixanthobacter aquaemixtae]|uniref:SDR family oxidoreductase n=1 Tax=Pontixanthobacter aquaemixtae TaxID=1958940 RepID=A0A844ZQC8_9SPHN|nr:SDR family oxidoreductase [Pontixanthobacter aquaemixtae]MXO89983.1 SDR family oxidoreductase [Pontixanthobacter aquaemixtae]
MASDLFDCVGKVALVTGGNGGIGLGFARGIAKQGGSLAIWARNEEKNAAAKQDLLDAGAQRVETYVVDVSSEENILAGYDKLLADFGRVDCVFANSGGPPGFNSVFDMPTDAWHKFLDVALHGAFITLREGARHMVARAEGGEPGGSLVGCGSLSLFRGLPGKQNYAASKCAVAGVIRCMAAEFGKHQIRANVVAPGLIMTPMMGGEANEKAMAEMFGPKMPIGRVGYPEDFEGVGAFLASDASSFMTGQTLTIDGGDMIAG